MGYPVGHDGVTLGPYDRFGPPRSTGGGPADRRAWLERRWDRVIDELAGELAVELAPIAHQPAAILGKLKEARELGWPVEVLGFWVAAARSAGCSWLQVGRRLGLSKQEAIEKLSGWEARFSGQVVGAPGNLPVPMTSFVGRAGDRAEVARLMTACRVVTLIGAPGVGKSRLALHAANVEASNRPGGAWWVDLAPVAENGLVAASVAASLSVPEQPRRSIVDGLSSHLRGLRLLLVLDNCEHLLDACASLTSILLRSCPGLSILATSRVPLGVAGEAVWAVPTLSLPAREDLGAESSETASDAVTLFCQRASEARADWVLTPECSPAVKDICRRLDGIPLAIELAAARVGALSPAEIASCLGDRLGFLVYGPRSSASHHQRTMGETLDWSHDLLSDSERAIFRRLSIFAGSFNQAAAEAVCAGGEVEAGSVLELLTHLVDRSLVVAVTTGPETRFRMLETMRCYASQRLAAAGESARLAARQASWYRALVERAEPGLTGAAQQHWLSLLETEYENIQAVLQWAESYEQVDTALAMAGSLTLFWRVHGRFSEGRRWLESALGMVDGDPGSRRKALWGAGFLVSMLGDRDAAIAYLEEALCLCSDRDDDRLGARCLLILADAQPFDTPEAALGPARQSVSLARQTGDTWCLGHALAVLGRTQVRLDAVDDGRAALEEAIAVGRQAQDLQSLRLGLMILGGVTLAAGDYRRCDALLGEGLDVARRLDEPYSVAMSLIQVARLAVGRGDWDKAREHLEEGLGLACRSGNPGVIALGHCVAGRLALADGDVVGANRHFGEALEVEREGWRSAWAIEGLGEAAVAMGDEAGARLHLDAVIGGPWTKNTKPLVARAIYQLGEMARAHRNHDEATTLHRRALRMRVANGDRAGIPDSIEALAAVATRAGRLQHAARLVGAAQTLRDARGYARWPPSEPGYEALLTEVRRRLGDSRFRDMWVAGTEMSVGQAVARALGSRVGPERPTTGWAALTASEERVAVLAAQGLTNPQIGADLYISRRTARAHLSSVFAKLDITSRKQLPGLVPLDVSS